MDLIRAISGEPAFGALLEAVRGATRAQRHILVRGSQGSSTSFVAAALARALKRPVVLVVAHLDEADECVNELSAHGMDAPLFPALETLPGETGVSTELLGARLGLIRRLLGAGAAGWPDVLVCPIQGLMQPVPPRESLARLVRTVSRGQRLDPGDLAEWLAGAGYSRVDAIEEPGDFSVRGGIVDIFPPLGSGGAGAADARTSSGAPIRIDFFGDEIDRLNEIDLDTMASDRAVDAAELVCVSIEKALASAAGGPRDVTPDDGQAMDLGPSRRGMKSKKPVSPVAHVAASGGVSFLDYLPAADAEGGGAVVILHETFEVIEQARGYYERLTDGGMGVIPPPELLKQLQQRFGCFIELNQFSPGTVSASDRRIELPVRALSPLPQDVSEGVREVAALSATHRVGVFASNEGELGRLRELIAEHAPDSAAKIDTAAAYVHRGFVWGEENRERTGGTPVPLSDGRAFAVVPYHELLHRFEARRSSVRGAAAAARMRAGRAIDTFLDFAPGDYVVHRDHGIGQFHGLSVMKGREVKKAAPVTLPGEKAKKRRRPGGEAESPDGTMPGEEEFLTIEFAGGSKLHVPCTRIDQVQKYVGGLGARGKPTLSTLGGTRWKKQKQDVAESVKDLAGELLRIRAAREHLPGVRYPADTPWQKEFEAEFPFEETQDQLAAIAEIKRDMQSERPMDRLLCGDVGFGKTEIAIRAAFKAVEFGKQVAVLVPTTVLAEQHERTFRSRFADYPFRVESISRFKTTQEINKVLADLRKGQVDVVIGTHRLLSKDVKFADLGLVVIDEEQRFGVEHKERLLALRMTVDVLTLSATPIPRTLHLSMLGLRDISSLATPPVDRRAVVTEVIPYNPRRIQQAINRELSRGGQCFFVHNRVYDIVSVADDVQKLAPEAAIVVGHGQMPDGELEDVMVRFMRGPAKSGGADILVSTTIIESGIDIPSANTMFITNADRFGLADLHQLRGRVGRYKHRAYCYLLLDPERNIPEKALKRLKAIEEFSMLGAGFKIAMRDLEIRGAGNILGAEQSGHIAAVGYEMYCQLLDRAVKELKHEPTQVASETSIEIGLTGLIPKAYIPSDVRRMEAYRRIATAASIADLRRVETELNQAYGEYPEGGGVDRLLQLAELRVAASTLNVRSIAIREKDVLLRVRPDSAQAVARALQAPAGEGANGERPRPGADTAYHVTLLPPASTDADAGHFEVYLRPPTPAHLEAVSLSRILRRRLVGALPGTAASTSPGAPEPITLRS